LFIFIITADVKRYSKEQIISIITSNKEPVKVEFDIQDCPIASATPTSELETTKPVPPKYATS